MGSQEMRHAMIMVALLVLGPSMSAEALTPARMPTTPSGSITLVLAVRFDAAPILPWNVQKIRSVEVRPISDSSLRIYLPLDIAITPLMDFQHRVPGTRFFVFKTTVRKDKYQDFLQRIARRERFRTNYLSNSSAVAPPDVVWKTGVIACGPGMQPGATEEHTQK